jgi:hypothetical protein
MLAEYFPKEMSGRANAALNLLHIGAAFVLQSAAGFIIACWPASHGGYPAEAHRAAMACTLVLEITALLWFAVPPRSPQRVVLAAGRAIGFADATLTALRYRRAVWAQRAGSLPRFATGWDAAAAASAMLFVAVAAVLSAAVSQPALAVYVVATGGDGQLAGDGAEPGREGMYADAADAPPEELESRQLRSLASRFTHGDAPRPPAISRPMPVTSSRMGHDGEGGRNAPTRLRTRLTYSSARTVEGQRLARYRSPRSHYRHGVPPAARMCAWSFSVIRSLWRFRARHRLARPRAPGRVALAGRNRNRHGYRAHKASAVVSAQMRFMEASARRPPSRSSR